MDRVQKIYLRRAKITAFLLSIVPFVRMVALDGSLARGQATKKSDIDFFIVTKNGRIWSCRMLVTVLIQLIGYRRYNNKIAGRICLNRYHTEEFLLVRPENQKNALDYRNFLIFWGSPKLRSRFFRSNNWIPKKGFSFVNKNRKNSFAERLFLAVAWPVQKLFEILYDLIFAEPGEQFLRKYQIKRILRDPRTQASSKEEIFISDYELRFHPPKA